MKLDVIISKINKQYGENTIGFAPVLGFKDIERITSGSLFLDWALGKGKNTSGWPLGRIVELYGPESAGKCIAKDTLILNPLTGELKKIQDINKKKDFVATAVIGEARVASIDNICSNGIKHVYELTLQTGKKIRATSNHSFLVFPIKTKKNRRMYKVSHEICWKTLKELTDSDLIATPRELPFFGKVVIPNDDLKLLGYMISDGYISRSTPCFTNTNKKIAKEFLEICKRKDWLVRKRCKQGLTVDYFIIGGKRGSHLRNPFNDFIDKYKLKVVKSGNKEIPEIIFKLKKEKIAIFLNRLFSGDGWCSFGKNGRQVAIGYSSKSWKLISQVQHLLLRFGIIVTISKKYIKGNNYYSFEFGAKEYVRKFIKDIGLLKAEHRYKEIENIYEMTQDRVSPFIRYNFMFEKIREIKYIGKLLTYDLTIPITHNFIANDIIVHNSLISLLTIAEQQRKGENCVYFDAENSFDKSFAKSLGVNVDKLIVSRESQGEKVIDIACELLDSGDVRIIVFDSLAAMIPSVEVEDPLEQIQMAPMARLMSKALRKLTLFNKHNTLVMFINQLRVNPGAGRYSNPEYTPGGRSLKFYSSIRLDVRKGDWIFSTKDKKKKVGQVVKFRVAKNKSAIPLKEGYFKFLYKGKIDRVDELISLGLLNGAVTRNGAYFTLCGKKFLGKDNMEAELKKDSNFFEKAKVEVFK